MNLKIRKAAPQEIEKGLDLLRQAALWLKDNNIDYWQNWIDPPAEHVEWVKEGFDNHEFHFVENDADEIIGMYRLQFEDEMFWGKRNDKTGYIHSFTTDRTLKGNGIGYTILHLIEQSLLDKGIYRLRLDCGQDNERLCKYYEDFDFVSKGTVTVGNEKLQLYEKKIVGSTIA